MGWSATSGEVENSTQMLLKQKYASRNENNMERNENEQKSTSNQSKEKSDENAIN